MAGASRRRLNLVSIVVLVLLVALFWWVESGDDTGAEVATDPSVGSTSSFVTEPSPSGSPSGSPTASASASVTAKPSPPPRSSPVPTSAPTDDVPSIDPLSGLPVVLESELPDEAIDVLAQIDAGGPYDYPGNDDTTFGNYEGVLPERARGHYREYTVETPGLSHRGPLRIVVGDGVEFYWTEDHYESFSRIWR